MKIIEQNVCFPRWCDSHKIEMDEARAFVDSKAHMAELDLNPSFSISRQRINYQRAFCYTLLSSGGNYHDYKVSMCKGKIIVEWLKYKKDGEQNEQDTIGDCDGRKEKDMHQLRR